MNADQLDWLTERVLGAVFEVNTSARGPANAPDPEGTPVAAPIGVSRSSTFVSRTTLHIAIHDKVVLNSSMGNQPENIEEPTGSGAGPRNRNSGERLPPRVWRNTRSAAGVHAQENRHPDSWRWAF